MKSDYNIKKEEIKKKKEERKRLELELKEKRKTERISLREKLQLRRFENEEKKLRKAQELEERYKQYKEKTILDNNQDLETKKTNSDSLISAEESVKDKLRKYLERYANEISINAYIETSVYLPNKTSIALAISIPILEKRLVDTGDEKEKENIEEQLNIFYDILEEYGNFNYPCLFFNLGTEEQKDFDEMAKLVVKKFEKDFANEIQAELDRQKERRDRLTNRVRGLLEEEKTKEEKSEEKNIEEEKTILKKKQTTHKNETNNNAPCFKRRNEVGKDAYFIESPEGFWHENIAVLKKGNNRDQIVINKVLKNLRKNKVFCYPYLGKAFSEDGQEIVLIACFYKEEQYESFCEALSSAGLHESQLPSSTVYMERAGVDIDFCNYYIDEQTRTKANNEQEQQ